MTQTSFAARLHAALGSRLARLLGLALSALLILWICRILYLERGRLAAVELDGAFFMAAGISVAVVVLGNLVGSVAGWILLRKQAVEITLPFVVAVNGLAQLAKYLPGNVLHLVGRFILIRERSDAKVALAFSLYEILLLCLSGAGLGLLYVYYVEPATWALPSLLILSAVLLGTGVWLLYRVAFLRASLRELAAVVALYLLSYLAFGFAFSLLFQLVFDVDEASVLLCAVLFALAFVIGYVTPGAPGGLGVREFVFMLLAQPLLDTTLAVSAVVMFRLFSIAGDLVFALGALGVKRWYKITLVRG